MSEMAEMHAESVERRATADANRIKKFAELVGFQPPANRAPYRLEEVAVTAIVRGIADDAARAQYRFDSITRRNTDINAPRGAEVLALAVQIVRVLAVIRDHHYGRLTFALNLFKEFGFNEGTPVKAIGAAIARYERDEESDWDDGFNEEGSLISLKAYLAQVDAEAVGLGVGS